MSITVEFGGDFAYGRPYIEALEKYVALLEAALETEQLEALSDEKKPVLIAQKKYEGDPFPVGKMTEQVFQKAYHTYFAHNEEEAQQQADLIEIEEGDKIVAVSMGNLGWALMLERSANALKNIIPEALSE